MQNLMEYDFLNSKEALLKILAVHNDIFLLKVLNIMMNQEGGIIEKSLNSLAMLFFYEYFWKKYSNERRKRLSIR